MAAEGSSSTVQPSSAAPASIAIQDGEHSQQDLDQLISPAKDAPHLSLRFKDSSQQPREGQGHQKSDKPAAAEGAPAGV